MAVSRRQFLLGGVAAGAGLLATACGSSSGGSSAGGTSAAGGGSGGGGKSSGGELNVYSFSSNTVPASAVNAVFDGFTKATGIKVKQTQEPADYATFVQKITTALSSGFTGYDVIYMDDFTNQTFGAAGWLVPLQDKVDKSAITALSTTHRNLSTVKGNLYRVPINQSFYIQFYRKDLLKAAGLNPPTSWSQILSTARALTKKGKYGLSLAGVPSDAFDDFLYFMPQAGGDFLNLDLPGSQKALEFLHDLVTTYKVVPKSYVTDSYTTIPTYFESGDVALWASWNGFVDGFVADKKFYQGGKALGLAGPAKGPVSDVTDVGDWGWSISKYAPNLANAVKFVDYATTKSAETIWAKTQAVPARQDAVEASRRILVGGEDFARILSTGKQVPRPISPQTTQIQNSVAPILVDYVAGKTSLSTAVKSGQALIKKYTS